LILLNGPPGIGKSTLARMYVDDHPLALNLDIDRVRDLLGRWRDNLHAAGLAARAIALAAARTHLAGGHDVVVPQFLGRIEFIEQLEALGRETGARFHQIVLLDSKSGAIARFGRRGEYPDVTESELAEMHDRLMKILAVRPDAVTLRSADGAVQQAYGEMLRRLG
jgi:predicted kinase